MQHRFLEDEEAELARPLDSQPSEENGFGSLAAPIGRAVALAGAAFGMAPQADSPIEIMLGGRLSLALDIWNSNCEPKLTLVPQYPIARFRYDFAILASEKLVLAIECDGKDWHSTDAQRANDAAKSALVWSLGAEIERFSGAKIFHREPECVDRIMRYIHRKFGASK